MASSRGNPSMSTEFQTSGSEDDLQLTMDERKRKRIKQSNRESARRYRRKKQKQLDDLTAEEERLRKENSEIITSVNITTQHYLKVEAENCILRTQISELSQRLESLNEIIDLINTTNGVYKMDCFPTMADDFMNMASFDQEIMTSADMFQW